MAPSVKHLKVSAIPDAGDNALVEPSDWNAEHVIVGLEIGADVEAWSANLDAWSNVPVANMQGKITLTTTGTSGAATFDGTTLNIPNYSFTDTGITQLTGDVMAGPGNGSQAATVVALNGTNLAALANGVLKITTGTGVPTSVAAPTGAIVGTTDSQTLTNKIISGAANTISNINLTSQVTGTLPVGNGGTGTTTATGSGSVVRNTSPTLVTPVLGTPTSGVATNLTGLPLTTGVTGVLLVANGGTNANTLTAHGVLLGQGTGTVTAVSPGTSGYALIANGGSSDPTYQGYAPAGTGATTRTWQGKVGEIPPTPYDFGAVGDGTTDDTAALNAWYTEVVAYGIGYLAPGVYRATANLTWALPAHAPIITGAGMASRIKFDAGFGLDVVGVTTSTAVFYLRLADFWVTGSTTTGGTRPIIKFSVGTGDALNGAIIDNIVVNNGGASGSVGVVFNGLYTSRVFMTVNCAGTGIGTAVKIGAANMNTLKFACGNSGTGLYLTSTGGAAVGGNLFDACDFEVNGTNVLIDSNNVENNTFAGGIMTMTASGNIGIDATGGQGNEFRNMLYGGLGTLFSPTTGHKVGFTWVNRVQSFVTAPAVAASGTAVTNTTGQTALVNISGGTVSAVVVDGVTIAITTGCTVIVDNGKTITLTYSSAPTWRWQVANF